MYGIQVPAGATDLALEIFDGPWYDRIYGAGVCGGSRTGDQQSSDTTWFTLYGPDPTPLDATDGNELLCWVKYDPRSPGRSVDVPGWDDSWRDWDDVSPQALIGQLWDDVATSADREPGCAADFDRGPGIYPLWVMMEHDDSQNSYNRFSVRVTTTGPAPSMFGLGDMAVYANEWAGCEIDIFLAKVGPQHAGKELVIELFDVGDISGGSGGDQLEFYNGTGGLLECSWVSDDGESEPMGTCIIRVPTSWFNGELLTITVPIALDLHLHLVSSAGTRSSTCTPGRSTTPPPGRFTWLATRSGWSSRGDPWASRQTRRAAGLVRPDSVGSWSCRWVSLGDPGGAGRRPRPSSSS